MREQERRSGKRLRDAAERAGELAREARDLREQRRGVADGHVLPELDRPLGTSVDWRIDAGDERADRVRAGDDVRTAERQERLARNEQEVAAVLGENADALRALASDLQETRRRMRETRQKTESLAADLRANHEAVRQTRELARRTGTGRRARGDARRDPER